MTPALLQKEHLPSVASLEKAVFAHPWSEASLLLLTDAPHFGYVMADETNTVYAYVGVIVAADEGQFTNVATRKEYRRRGYAKALLQAVKEEAARRHLTALTLEVRRSNEAAIALYESFGFQVVGERPHFYQAPREDALLMSCPIFSC